jgi:hypothetical protein
MKEVICAYCGKNTYDVDIEYLIGGNHLSCVLMDQLGDAIDKEEKAKNKKPMEIKNWTKLNGQKFDVMGASFVITDTAIPGLSDGTIYSAWIHPLNDSAAFLRVTLFTNDMHLQIKVIPPLDYDGSGIPIELTTTIDKLHLSNPSIFIQTIAEGLTDDPTVIDIIQFVGRKQDNTTRFKGRGYTQLTGTNGSSGFGGNNLW